MSTPTFYAAYTRKCRPSDFESLRYAVCGAERLRPSVATAFKVDLAGVRALAVEMTRCAAA